MKRYFEVGNAVFFFDFAVSNGHACEAYLTMNAEVYRSLKQFTNLVFPDKFIDQLSGKRFELFDCIESNDKMSICGIYNEVV